MAKLVSRALISVYDKEGIVPFAQRLQHTGVELVSSGGTFKHLTQAGIMVRAVEEITKHPEILDGRVKMLRIICCAPSVHI